MYKSESSYSQRADDIIRKFGMTIPFIIVVYGLLIQFGWVASTNYGGPYMFAGITLGWLVLGIFQFTTPSSNALTSLLRLSADHILAGLSCIFITDSVLILWPILMMASYIFFDSRGVLYNILGFVLIIVIDIFMHINDAPYIFTIIMTFAAIVVTSVAVIVVSKTHEIKQDKLYQSEIKESLQRDRVAAIVNNLTDAIISTNTKGIVRVSNASSLDLLDTNGPINGHSINKILPLVDKNNKPIDLLYELQQSKSVVQRDDLYYIVSKDEKLRLAVTYTPIRRGYSNTKKTELHDGYIIILRDITKQKSLEEERDEFISVASHELRTPITIAEGTISNVQMMMDRPDVTSAMLRDSINVAHDQVVFLANMVNDLGALSRAEKGTADSPEDIDVKGLASDLMNRYSDEAKKKKLSLDLDISPKLDKVHCSKLYVEELLQNFLTNSIKYTEKGGITIIVKQDNGQITFSVRDTGIGISKADQGKIFTKFYRSEDFRTRESSGTGLGLYVAAKLARQLGTTVVLTSRLNFGSTFSFTLPATVPDIALPK